MTAIRRAMLLAAGRGERLRPLTLSVPKPLLPVGGKPLIAWHLEKLATGGITDVAINTSWLGGKLRAALGDGASVGVNIAWFDEGPEPLEVAGGIRNALAFFAGEPFVAVNGDVWTTCPLPPAAPGPGRLAHLVLVPNPPEHPQGDFGLECGEARVTGVVRYTFSGIATYQPALFAALAPGRRPLLPVLQTAMLAGRVSGELYPGPWTDAGTPARLEALDRAVTVHGR